MIASKIRQPKGANGWLNINTAPRDGSPVWLWNKHVDNPADAPQWFVWSKDYSVFGLGGCWTNGFGATMGDGIDFDYWRPALPANFANPYDDDSGEEEDPILEALLYAREKMWEYGFKEDDIRPVRLAIDLIAARNGSYVPDIMALHDATVEALNSTD